MDVRLAGVDPLRLGISSCLLGQPVRFDGGHKRDAFITDILGPFVEWVPVCPEVEAGFGTPRETMRLVNTDGTVRLITRTSGEDLTARMERFSGARVRMLSKSPLHGYVLKKDSPSCGMERVKVYDRHSSPARTGQGLYATALRQRFPHLPIEEEGRLSDPRLRENFIERVFAYHRLLALFGSRWTIGALVSFHTAHKLTLMAHSVTAYRDLGRLVAGAKTRPRAEIEAAYQAGFMAALSTLATTRKHTNALQHMAGYFKTSLDTASKAELHEAIGDYRAGLVPLIVPITLIRHHVRVHDVAYLAGQTYLQPHPRELMLRNHV
jgi:uncharacterized protein YbgA (DUF1722 family)/uncharacterized protein YbbK (DUF523 family)